MKNNQILNFIDWYKKSKEGNGSNYISNNFKGDEELFTLSVFDCAIQYAIAFGQNPFDVEKGKISEQISVISENLYEKKDSSFHIYSEKINNHMPKALLGKQNYLQYLSTINKHEVFTPKIELIKVERKESTVMYPQSELYKKFIFRLITQDRYYSFLYYPISVLKKLFYLNPTDKAFFDQWVKNQIDSIQFHTMDGVFKFTDVDSLELKKGEVFISIGTKSHKLFTPVAGGETLMPFTTGSLQDIVIDHIEPFEKQLFEIKEQLPILQAIHQLLINFNDGNDLRNGDDLKPCGNLLVETTEFSNESMTDLRKELNLISSFVKLQMMDRKENLYKKKFD